MERLLTYEFLLRWLIVWKKLSLRYTLMTDEYFKCQYHLSWLTKEMKFYRAPEYDTEATVLFLTKKGIKLNVNIQIKHAHVRIPIKGEEIHENSISNFVIGFFREQYQDYPGVIYRTDGSMWRLETYWAHCN